MFLHGSLLIAVLLRTCRPLPKSALAGGPAKGTMFWQWYDEGQRAPAEEGGTIDGLFGEAGCCCGRSPGLHEILRPVRSGAGWLAVCPWEEDQARFSGSPSAC